MTFSLIFSIHTNLVLLGGKIRFLANEAGSKTIAKLVFVFQMV